MKPDGGECRASAGRLWLAARTMRRAVTTTTNNRHASRRSSIGTGVADAFEAELKARIGG
jgi:hypothetical protein